MTMRTYSLTLILILFSGVFTTKTHAEDSIRGVVLYTPYTEIAVPPGESIDYNVDVINHSRVTKNASLSISGLPRGWKHEMKAGSWTINRLAVLPGEKKSFSLKVEVPLKVNKGRYHFVVSANGVGRLPLAIVISEQGTFKTEFTTSQPNMEGNAKSTFTFNASLKNSTAEQQLYALLANAPRGWNVVFKADYKQATSAQVAPNATANISVDITPPVNVAAGKYEIPVRATTGSTSADLNLEVVVTGSYQMELATPTGLLSSKITVGSTKRIDLMVKNTGSADLRDVQLSSEKPVDWEVSFEPAKVERVKPGESVPVSAIVKASKKALPGDYVVKMEAKTPEVASSAEFRIAVETSMLWGWLGVILIVGVLGGIYYLFRKYGRR